MPTTTSGFARMHVEVRQHQPTGRCLSNTTIVNRPSDVFRAAKDALLIIQAVLRTPVQIIWLMMSYVKMPK